MVQIRQAVHTDAYFICELNKNAFGYEYPLGKTEERLNYILQRNTDKIWVACENGKVIGYIHGADYECTYSESLKNIMSIAVDEKYRYRGIGKKLLITVEKWAEEDNCMGVRLVSSFSREEAHKFYLHCGYTHRKDQKNFVKYF